MPLSRRTKGLLYTLSGVSILIPDALFIRFSSLGDWQLVYWRGILAGLVFSGIVLLSCLQRKSFAGLKIGKNGLLLALCLAIANCTFILSMVLTKAANVLVILALAPMFSALIDRIFRNLRLARRTWIATIICLLGVVVLVADGIDSGSHMGNLYALLTAAVLGAEFSLMGCTRPESVAPALCLGYIISAVVGALLAPTLAITGASIAPILTMGLVIVPVSFFLISKGPRYLPAPEVALFLLLETVCGPFLVWLFLNEEPGRFALIGGIIVITTLTWHSVIELRKERCSETGTETFESH